MKGGQWLHISDTVVKKVDAAYLRKARVYMAFYEKL